MGTLCLTSGSPSLLLITAMAGMQASSSGRVADEVAVRAAADAGRATPVEAATVGNATTVHALAILTMATIGTLPVAQLHTSPVDTGAHLAIRRIQALATRAAFVTGTAAVHIDFVFIHFEVQAVVG